jgi:O-antigen/teichoic acid export membrane protein
VNKVLSNFFTLSLGEASSKVFGFLSTIYLARVLGSEGFGQYAFVLAIYSYFALLANPGFETVGTREVAKGSYSIKVIFGSIFALRILFSILSFIVLLLCALLLHFENTVRVLLLTQGLNLLLTPLLIQFVFRGLTEMKYISLARILQSSSFLLLAFFFVRSQDDILHLPYLLLISTIASLLPLIILYRKRFGGYSIETSAKVRKAVLHSSVIFGASGFMILIYYNLDSVMLGILRSKSEVGIYSAAYKIVLFILGFQTLFSQSLLPVLSQFVGAGKDRKVLLERSFALILWLSTPVLLVGFFYSTQICVAVYGKGYSDSSEALRILCFVIFLIFNECITSVFLVAEGKMREHLTSVTIGAIMNFIMNLLLIPRYGVLGAAAATVFSELWVFSLLMWFMNRAIEVRIAATLAQFIGVVVILGSIMLYYSNVGLVLILVTSTVLVTNSARSLSFVKSE